MRGSENGRSTENDLIKEEKSLQDSNEIEMKEQEQKEGLSLTKKVQEEDI